MLTFDSTTDRVGRPAADSDFGLRSTRFRNTSHVVDKQHAYAVRSCAGAVARYGRRSASSGHFRLRPFPYSLLQCAPSGRAHATRSRGRNGFLIRRKGEERNGEFFVLCRSGVAANIVMWFLFRESGRPNRPMFECRADGAVKMVKTAH